MRYNVTYRKDGEINRVVINAKNGGHAAALTRHQYGNVFLIKIVSMGG